MSLASLKQVAGINVGDRNGEEGEADRQHGDVHHENAPVMNSLREDASRPRRGLDLSQSCAGMPVPRSQVSPRNSRELEAKNYRNPIKIGPETISEALRKAGIDLDGGCCSGEAEIGADIDLCVRQEHPRQRHIKAHESRYCSGVGIVVRPELNVGRHAFDYLPAEIHVKNVVAMIAAGQAVLENINLGYQQKRKAVGQAEPDRADQAAFD